MISFPSVNQGGCCLWRALPLCPGMLLKVRFLGIRGNPNQKQRYWTFSFLFAVTALSVVSDFSTAACVSEKVKEAFSILILLFPGITQSWLDFQCHAKQFHGCCDPFSCAISPNTTHPSRDPSILLLALWLYRHSRVSLGRGYPLGPSSVPLVPSQVW